MPWARFEDRFQEHPKVRKAWRAAPAAIGLHVMAVTYCAGNLTDGYVPSAWVESQFRRDRDEKAAVAALVDAGMWDPADDGWTIHDYLEYQPTKESVLAKRQRNAENGRKGGEAKAKRTSSDSPADRQTVASDLSKPRTRTQSPTRTHVSPDGETPPPAAANRAALTAPEPVVAMLRTAGFEPLDIEQSDAGIRNALSDLELPDDVDWWRFGQEIQKAREAGRMRHATPASAIRFIARGASGPPRLGHGPAPAATGRVDHYAAMAAQHDQETHA
jgi:hypothetical protein